MVLCFVFLPHGGEKGENISQFRSIIFHIARFIIISYRCWTALLTWWKRPGGRWACSGDARSQIVRSSTTGGGVLASRRTHAREAPARLLSPRCTARTLQSRVGSALFFSPVGLPQKPIMLSLLLRVAPIVFHERRFPPVPHPHLMYPGMKPNQQKSVIMGFFSKLTPIYEKNRTDLTLIVFCGLAV